MSETGGDRSLGGRPTLYSEELGDLICALLMQGHSLIRICTLDNMPAESTVYSWLAKDGHPFLDKYRIAREIQAERMADELVVIADDDSGDVSGELNMPNAVAVNRAKLRVDTRKWIASRLLPKKYGDKLQQDVNVKGELTLAESIAKARNRAHDA